MAESQKTTSQAERVLIVEDDAATRAGLAELVRTWGFVTEAAANGEEALKLITSFRPAIVVTDMVMPRMDGMELLKALRDDADQLKVIMLTAQGSVETAVEAVKVGAEDYLTKPVDPQKLRLLLQRIAELNAQKRENEVLRRQLREKGSFGRIVGHSPKMRKIYQVIEQAAPTTASVLIIGESGTGKELVAQTIHQLSPRTNAPFVGINCAAIPETLLESEIFGHERGAFTGAIDRRAGCFELADRGTLFLDEIAEMVPVTQVKLLRVLQERTFRRLGRAGRAGSGRPRAGRDQHEPDRGHSRRQAARRSLLPPQRVHDRAAAAPRSQGRPAAPHSGAGRRVQRARPPQRARQSRRTRCGCSSSTIGPATCASCATSSSARRFSRAASSSRRSTCRASAPPPRPIEPTSGVTIAPGMTVDEAERKLILATLEAAGNNKTRAAEMLGISLKTLHNKLNRMKQTT